MGKPKIVGPPPAVGAKARQAKQDEVLARLAAGEITVAECKSLLPNRGGARVVKTQKGCVAVAGLRQYPAAALYPDEWAVVLDLTDEIRAACTAKRCPANRS
mgnify:CR=1 FL=1